MSIQEGGCLCGAVRYRVTGLPLYSAICHCRSCRRAAAAPAVAWQTFEWQQFELLAGTPRTYRSSPGVRRTFCENCGTPLTYSSEQRSQQVDITSASLDDPEITPPRSEVWLEDKLAWVSPDRARRQFEHAGE
jgi:hypothetical protein